MHAPRLLLAALLMSVISASGLAEETAPSAEAATASWFEKHVRPVLATKCLKCHGREKQEGKLRLDSLAAILRGGENGPAIVPGKPAESLLVEAINYQSLEMPPTGRLAPQEVESLESWIARGAPWPARKEQLRSGATRITAADRQWWSFRPLSKPSVPVVEGDQWSRNPIDRFVLRKLAEQGLQPAPQADRATLARRLYFDLLGLPPTPEQIDEFVQDDSPTAWEDLIDRLLADTGYGEHWARYWLDVVRYAESDGWKQDAYRPHMWRYRDYVVQSFNEDKSYPEFVLQQLAGDEIPDDDPENLAATGFLRLGIYEYNQRDAKSHWIDIMNEITDVTGDVFFGMGMACARCHDHKFDPLLQRDYFQLQAFFQPLIWRDDLPYATDQQRAAFDQQQAVWEEATGEIRARMDSLLKPYRDRKIKATVDKFPLDIQACFQRTLEQRSSWDQQMTYLIERQVEEEGTGPLQSMNKEDKQRYEALQKELDEFDHLKPQPLPSLMAVSDFAGRISPTVIPDDPEQAGIEPAFLTVLSGEAKEAVPAATLIARFSGRRTALASWIGRGDNPLTTRVIVNRVWQQHFGQGIVPTANDFGHLGQAPTHPELLDWLTVTFVENGWSLKRLHKLILMSATWRQSARHPRAAALQQQDPAESLLWRARVRRLSAEQIRDAMLLMTGELQRGVGGPSVDRKTPRRSLYVKSFRNAPDEFLQAFDVANGLKSVAERNRTTTPTQSLLMINGDYALARAKKWARRLQQREGETPPDFIDYAVRCAWGRKPTPAERKKSLAFVGLAADQPTTAIDGERLVDFSHVLLNSNQFLYVD